MTIMKALKELIAEKIKQIKQTEEYEKWEHELKEQRAELEYGHYKTIYKIEEDAKKMELFNEQITYTHNRMTIVNELKVRGFGETQINEYLDNMENSIDNDN